MAIGNSVASLSLSKLVEIIQQECKNKYSCSAYAERLRRKALRKGGFTPENISEDYRLLMQILSYDQTAGKLEVEMGLTGFKDDLGIPELKDQLWLSEIEDRSKLNSEEARKLNNKISELNSQINSKGKKLDLYIDKITSVYDRVSDDLLKARFADFLATNEAKKAKVPYLQDAIECYSKVIEILQEDENSYDYTKHIAIAVLLKRTNILCVDLIEQRDERVHCDVLIEEIWGRTKGQLSHFWDHSDDKSERYALDLIDYFCNTLFGKKSTERVFCHKYIYLTTDIANLCLSYLYKRIDHHDKKLIRLDQHRKNKQQIPFEELELHTLLIVECLHRKLVIYRYVGVPNNDPTIYKKIVYSIVNRLHNTLGIQDYHKTGDVFRLSCIVRECIYVHSLIQTFGINIKGGEKFFSEEFIKILKNTLGRLAKIRPNDKIKQLKAEARQSADPEAFKKEFLDYILREQFELTLSNFGVFFNVAIKDTSSFALKESFSIANLLWRRCHERYYTNYPPTQIDREKMGLTEKQAALTGEHLDASAVLRLPLIRVVAYTSFFMSEMIQRIKKAEATKVVKKIGKRKLRYFVGLSRITSKEHKKIVAHTLQMGLTAHTPEDWLAVARVVIPEIEYCLRYWNTSTKNKIFLNELLKQAANSVGVLGRNNIFYLQMILGNKSGSNEELVDLRNRVLHGDVTDLQAQDETDTYKFIWYLFFHMICEFIPDDAPLYKRTK